MIEDMLAYENIARKVARQFYWQSATFEDRLQEARLALFRCPVKLSPAVAQIVVRNCMIQHLRKETRRHRPQFVLFDVEPASLPLEEQVENRETLRQVLATNFSPIERCALGRAIRGEGCTEPKVIDNALQRARKKLAA